MIRQVVFSLLLLATLASSAQVTDHKPAQYNVSGILWQQQSGEYKALCYQAYNLARMRLEEILRTYRDTVPLAIVTDVDETVLDNSIGAAKDIVSGRTYNDSSWKVWVEYAKAPAMPGAVEFFNYAAQHGVQCFYITNRKETDKAATIRNLKEQGFPQVDAMHVMCKQGSVSDKEPRRQEVAKQYNIVLLLGDNLNDFDDLFFDKPTVVRNANVDKVQSYFGSRYIMLPNATYGDWENALWHGKKLSAEEKDKLKWDSLVIY
ncbi:MAG TPA: 5'-nucleotidase, lipoprotein e(P4) family [Ferruginibacter sp.]|nr:5'-nucleotidase, lipoprotein e(P4) family [Ferruginibacter sp.]